MDSRWIINYANLYRLCDEPVRWEIVLGMILGLKWIEMGKEFLKSLLFSKTSLLLIVCTIESIFKEKLYNFETT